MTKVEDFKNSRGLWVRSYIREGRQISTRGGKLHDRMKSRCRLGGKTQKDQPTYMGCSYSEVLGDFQSFTTWCQKQVGYLAGFALEKDVLVRGNKVYSEDTCVFLPQTINNLLLQSGAIRGKYPIGVSSDKRWKTFQATCRYGVGRKSKFLGSYNTIEEAFLAYKTFKEATIRQVAEQYKAVVDVRAYNALMRYEVLITD